tara:strand:+ start:363 stop:1094 length:732 start_codon:yes stop_codon:yes gene_type:complete
MDRVKSDAENRNFYPMIEGETIDLCAPNLDPGVLENWSQWFNDMDTTRFIDQGVYPNTIDAQKEFVSAAMKSKDRMIFLIRSKSGNKYVGVAALSSIDLYNRSCQISHVIGEKMESPNSMFYSLEAKCLLTQHAFDKLGVERIQTSQRADLARWQQWQPIFGFKPEGYFRNASRKGQQVHDVICSSCILKDFEKLKALRGGSLWPGKDKLFQALKKLPKETSIDRLRTFFESEYKKLDEHFLK